MSDGTSKVIRELGLEGFIHVQFAENLKKYPMMKRLFQRAGAAPEEGTDIPTPFTMCLDDDSYRTAARPHHWLARVRHGMASADLMGAVYGLWLLGKQSAWIENQPWYTGLPVSHDHKVKFCTG